MGNVRMILKTFREHNMLLADKVGLEYSAGTLLRYETTLKHTNEFIKWKYQHDDIDIVMLDNEFMMDFELWYRRVRNYNHNTAVKNLANLKRIVRLCVAKGWLQQDPFNTFKSSRREVSGLAPSEIEIARISNAEVGVGRLAYSKDIFLFCAHTKLTLVDIRQFRRSDMMHDSRSGGTWLVMRRPSLGLSSHLLLSPIALNVLTKYQSHSDCVLEDRILPVMSKFKLGSYLKIIADLCGLKCDLSLVI